VWRIRSGEIAKMEWNEPYLMRFAFRFGADGRTAEARLGFPYADAEHPREWVCAFQIHGLEENKIRRARGVDGLQALMIACGAIRSSLDQLEFVNSEAEPYEVIFPRYVPFCLGLDFHRNLCKLVDAEVKKEQERLDRWRARKR
jgi:hypothetical protein